MNFKPIFLLVTLLLLLSCKMEKGQKQSKQTFDFDQYFEKVKKVDNCMGEGDSFMTLSKRLDEGVKAPLDTIISEQVLKDLYYEAHKRQMAAGPKKEIKCSDLNYVVKDRVLQRLSAIASDGAMDVLIDLYKDESLEFIGNDGQGLTRSMTNCGEAIIEKLEPIKELRPAIGTRVISNIKNGYKQ